MAILMLLLSQVNVNCFAEAASSAIGSSKEYVVLSKSKNEISKIVDRNYKATEVRNACKDSYEYLSVYRMNESVADDLDKNKDIIVEEDKLLKASGKKVISKKDVDIFWNKKMIKADKIKKKKPQKQVKVAVIDSGVDWGNDIELQESISFVPGEENMNPLFMDGTGHGNSVAGLIAAEENDSGITGINSNALIYSIRVLDDNNTAPVSRVIQGIYYAIEKKVDIINMSFGMNNYSKTLQEAVDDAEDAGILVVAAAGNTGGDVEYPAAYSNVLSVGSVDCNAELVETSARGSKVDIVAPGEVVCATGELGDVLISSGTSLAAPQVAAVASLIWQENPEATSDLIKTTLLESSNRKTNKAYGILDGKYALESYKYISKHHKDNRQISLENRTRINTFDISEDVVGSWTMDSHEYLVGSGHSNVKKGARYPDQLDRFSSIETNPGWHGSYHVNYIAAYIYATRMAEKLGSGSSASNASTVSGLSSAEKSNMLGDVNSINWSSVGMTTDGKKRAFVWGMAMHTAADVFAHSAFVRSGNTWCHLAHGKNGNNNYADNTGKYPERFQAAENVVSKIVEKYDAKSGAGSYAQFTAMSTVGRTFRLKDLNGNVLATNASANISSFDPFSITNANFDYSWAG